jgi:hypothetical protein
LRRLIAALSGIRLPDLQLNAALHPHDLHASFCHSGAVASRRTGSRSNLFDSAHDLAGRPAFGVTRQAMELSMSVRVLLCVPAISAGMIVAAIALEANTAAAVECITEPNREPPEGSHWYYRVDRATDRKCWYLRALMPGPSEPSVAAAPQRASARPAVAPAVRRSKPMSESEEAALYLEFLRWKEQRRSAQ